MSKGSASDRIPAELFKVLKSDAAKVMLLKCCTQYVSKFGKLSSGHWTGKGQYSFQSQRREMPKNVPTTILLGPFYILARLPSKSFKLGFSSMWNNNFQIYNMGFQRDRGNRDEIANIHWILKKAREFQTNIYFCFIDYVKDFDHGDHNKPQKILKEMR